MKLKSFIYLCIASVIALFSACSPDEYDLGAKDVTPDDLVEGIAYTVTHDANNPNIVYLESKLGASYTPLWSHPQGRSQKQKVTLQIAFPGTYEVKFGVETRGGVVYGNPVTFKVDNFYAEFVSDELWELLSGGVGNAKTWYLDLDAYGLSRYFVGPLFFYGTDDSWETVTNGVKLPDGSDSWSWDADWPGNSWIMDAADFGTMTFDLKDGANVVVEHKTISGRGTEKGTYMLDVNEHTLRMTDATPLHDTNRDGVVIDWGDIKILSLTENTMQLAVLRDAALSGEGACLLVYNFISQDYYDNWTPGEQVEPEPSLPADWRDYVEPKTNRVITYKLSDDTPFDWCNLDGSVKGINTVPARGGIEEVTLVINSGTGEYTITDIDGAEHSGEYTLSNEGIYTFSEALPEMALSADGRAWFKSNADHTLRIMSYETSDYSGGLTDLWLGSQELDDQGNLYQYMGYHFVVQTADAVKSFKATLSFFDENWTFFEAAPLFISGNGDYTFEIKGASDKPYGMFLDIHKILKDNPNMDVVIKDIKVDGTNITFDDGKIDRGEGDDSTTARRYILNPWGETADDAPNYVFNASIVVTVAVTMDNGTPFIAE
ncbi:hypothetical protein [Proteiniphilum sp.]|uniref:hypothetical protein n=1 Tax=Proteiniphilum sp. TaxID=1926877 RepID=UPI00331E711D